METVQAYVIDAVHWLKLGVEVTGRSCSPLVEFQPGADILSTAITPSWDQIGKLGATATIRTGPNYFLMREMNEERARKNAEGQTPRYALSTTVRAPAERPTNAEDKG